MQNVRNRIDVRLISMKMIIEKGYQNQATYHQKCLTII